MQIGLLAPQGWKGDYDGWRRRMPGRGPSSSREQAETLGFESLWVFDHFHTVPEPGEEITFEGFSVLTALAMATARVRLGHMVVCTGFRNPALTAKLSSTLDVISGGRFELGIGAGWKEEEWIAYGYGFPSLADRLSALGDHLEIITRMLEPGPVDVRGPLRLRPGRDQRAARPPGTAHPDHRRRQRATADRRLCDPFRRRAELRLHRARRCRARMRDVRERCEADGRDPATMRFSLYERDELMRDPGQARIDRLGELRRDRPRSLVAFPTRWSPTLEAQEAFAEDCRAAGIELGGRAADRGRLGQQLQRLGDRRGLTRCRIRHADDQLRLPAITMY